MEKSKFYFLFLFFLISLFLFNGVYARSDCFPDNTFQLCLNSYWSGEYLYCNIDDVVYCNNGCVLTYTGDDYCAGEGSEIPINPSDYSFSYIYSPYNPLSIDLYEDQYNEPSSLYENGVIHQWVGRYNAATNKRYFQYRNSSNGVNFTAPINLTGFNGGSGQGYGLGYVQKVGDLYYMFVGNFSKAENLVDIDVFSSSNKINWTLNCTGITGSGNKKNPAFIYNNLSSTWEMLLEEGSVNFNTYYWNSSNLCSGWTKYNNIHYVGIEEQNETRSSAPQIFFDGSNYIVYFSSYQLSAYFAEISVLRGKSLDDLTVIGANIINYSVGAIGNYFVSDVDIVITPGMPYNYYAYFIAVSTAGDVSLALAYDNANRTFEDVHHISAVVSTGSVYNLSGAICPPGNICDESVVISGQGTYSVMNVINRIYPNSESLTIKQKFSYILLTLLFVDIILIVLLFGIKAGKFVGFLLITIDLIFFFFFIGIGYIPIGFLVVAILLLIALVFLKIKGGN